MFSVQGNCVQCLVYKEHCVQCLVNKEQPYLILSVQGTMCTMFSLQGKPLCRMFTVYSMYGVLYDI